MRFSGTLVYLAFFYISILMTLVPTTAFAGDGGRNSTGSLTLPSLGSRVIDYGLIFGASAGIQMLTAYTLNAPSVAWFANESPRLSAWVGLTMSLPMWSYNTLLVAEPQRGTIGQRLTGIQVVQDSGEPIGLGRSLARSAIMFLGWELSHIAMFVPHNFATDEPVPWQYVALTAGSIYLIAEIVTIVFTGGRKSIADALLGTRIASRR